MLVNAKWEIFQLYYAITSNIQWDDDGFRFVLDTHWHNSPGVDMSHHADTLSWLHQRAFTTSKDHDYIKGPDYIKGSWLHQRVFTTSKDNDYIKWPDYIKGPSLHQTVLTTSKGLHYIKGSWLHQRTFTTLKDLHYIKGPSINCYWNSKFASRMF